VHIRIYAPSIIRTRFTTAPSRVHRVSSRVVMAGVRVRRSNINRSPIRVLASYILCPTPAHTTYAGSSRGQHAYSASPCKWVTSAGPHTPCNKGAVNVLPTNENPKGARLWFRVYSISCPVLGRVHRKPPRTIGGLHLPQSHTARFVGWCSSCGRPRQVISGGP